MMQTKGILVGAGTLPWTDRQTGAEVERPKVSISSGVVTSLPDIYDADSDVLKQAQALPFGTSVEVDLTMNRYKQVSVKAIRKAN